MKSSDNPAPRVPWHKFKHQAFDIDGTLLDSNLAHIWAWQDALESEQLFFPHLTLLLQLGLPARQLVEKFAFAFRDQKLALHIALRAGQLYAEKYAEFVQPYSGVHQLLEQLHAAGRKLYAVSAGSRAEAEATMSRFDIQGYFDAVITAEDSADGKPGPEPFSNLRERIGSRQNLITLGDSPYDLKAATAAGVPFVYIGHGGFPREWFKQAHSSFFNFHELLRTIAA